MMRWAGLGAIVVLIGVLSGRPFSASASSASPVGWAVLIENDSYGGRYRDLPVSYVNVTRMLTLLMRRGWPVDHILLVRNDSDPNLLRRTLDWMAARVRPDDTALFYVAGEYEFFARDLRWAAVLPALWKQVPTSRRVLIAETCFAERLTDAADGIAGIALPAVGPDEWDLWGLRETDRLIRGGAFTYFLTRALAAQPEDAPLAFDAAFGDAVAGARAYFRSIWTMPEVLASLHQARMYPERLALFPNPHLRHEMSDAAQGSSTPLRH